MANLVKLKKALTEGLDSLIEDEAKELKIAVEQGELISDSKQARLLLSAGLIEQLRDNSTTRYEEIVYKPTSKGIEVYNSIYKN